MKAKCTMVPANPATTDFQIQPLMLIRADQGAGNASSFFGRMASGLKVPDRGKQKKERCEGGDEAVDAHRPNKTELKVHKV